jgi:Fe-S oxidoreductase
MGLFGFGNNETLYFPGCFSSAFLDKKINNYRKILKKLDIPFEIQKDQVCCGGFFDESGYEKELRKTARDNQEQFSLKKTKKIITNCPLCYNTLKNYRDLLPNWDIQIEFILITILNKIREERDKARNYFSEPVAYYDSCYLARYSGIINEPRELLGLLGYKTIELPKNREETLCSGACGGLSITNPELASKIAIRLIKMLKKRGIKKIVTADPRDYWHLKENLAKLNIPPAELEIFEFSDLICDSLGINKD